MGRGWIMTKVVLLSLAILAVLALPIVISAKRLTAANHQWQKTHNELTSARSSVARVLELRSRQQTVAEQKRPDQDVIARINAVLAEAGIPTSSLAGVTPESDTELAGGKSSLRCQSVRISLKELTVEQIGDLLAYWTERQPLWIPTRIELVHVKSADEQHAGLYAMNVLLSATYVAR
jgi:hypothetical protein